MKMRKPGYTLLLGIFIVTGLVGFSSGVTPFWRSIGLCWGACNTDREAQFNLMLPRWFEREAYCLNADKQLKLLARLDPWLVRRIETKNLEFKLYRIKEMKGTLTVQERESYNSDPWRVKFYKPSGIFSHLSTKGNRVNIKNDVVKSCVKEGLIFPKIGRPPSSICVDYAKISFATNRYQVGVSWEKVAGKAYAHYKKRENIEHFMSKMKQHRWRDYDLKQRAVELVKSVPANQLATVDVDSRIQQEFLRMRCE